MHTHSWPESYFACATLPAAPIMPQAIAACACSCHTPRTQNRFGKKLPIGSLSVFHVHSTGSMLCWLSILELAARPIRALIVWVRCAGAGVGSGPDETATAPAGKRRPTNASAPSLSLTLACWRRRGGDLHRRLGCAGDVTGGGGGQV